MAEEFISATVSVEGSTISATKTRAAINRYGIALERAIKQNAPVNKNPTPSKGSRNGRAQIKVTTVGNLEDGLITFTVSGPEYFKYVISGTRAHRIVPKTAKALVFPWNVAARTSPVMGSLRRASRSPLSGYNRGPAGDLRRLVRSSDLSRKFDEAAFKGVNHPGSSANDFIPPAIAQTGPELQILFDTVGDEVGNQILNSLRSAFSGTMSIR